MAMTPVYHANRAPISPMSGLYEAVPKRVPLVAEGIRHRRNDVLPGEQKENQVMRDVIRDGNRQQCQYEVARRLARRDSAGDARREMAAGQEYDAENDREQ
jgi:hypothetical protein